MIFREPIGKVEEKRELLFRAIVIKRFRKVSRSEHRVLRFDDYREFMVNLVNLYVSGTLSVISVYDISNERIRTKRSVVAVERYRRTVRFLHEPRYCSRSSRAPKSFFVLNLTACKKSSSPIASFLGIEPLLASRLTVEGSTRLARRASR